MMKNINTIMHSDPKQKKSKQSLKAIVSNKVKDYSNDPYFMKKAEAAKELLTKYPVPKEFLSNK